MLLPSAISLTNPPYYPDKSFQSERSRSALWFLTTPFYTSLQERNTALLLLESDTEMLWELTDPIWISLGTERHGNSKGTEAETKIAPHMPNTANRQFIISL